MGIREQISRRPKLFGGISLGLVMAALAFMAMQWHSAKPRSPEGFFYSVDDGQSFFEHSIQLPPFDYQGKPAVRAHVFECGKTRFVGYLERYTPEAHKFLTALNAPGPKTPPSLAAVNAAQVSGREYKKPGQSTWVKGSNIPAVTQISTVTCPAGSSGTIAEVLP